MDFGAHFRKCDFQVHTPRDTNWVGPDAVTEEERQQYAQEFVASCRAKGLQAVAITDHHDLAFFTYVRDASYSETDDAGKPLAAHDRLVVFPGMELTLAVPCQALLILDADFPTSLLSQVVLALSISPAPDHDQKHAQTNRLEHIKTFEDLYKELNKKEFLRGRFIVLPHVGESRSFSMLRRGMAAQYKSMPCAGGYMDGSITQHGTGNANIVNGLAKEWGNKAIALFQTSDNRSRDFDRLGSHVTWVKWARPTAEAIRQACLARHSRISHTEPGLPAIRITGIEVSNSKFLGPIVLDVNPQYNAIIGGRGTGKSTILEYIRWALCDQPPSSPDAADGELVDFQRMRKTLIEGTLLPLDAVVDVSFLLNRVPHIIRRKASGELTLKIGDASFQACTEQNGHMLSAAIAHQILQQESPPTIDKIKAVLALHPWHSTRWQNSLAPFAGADTDVMLFMLASRWADDIRTTDKSQHRGPWHYVNMPFKPAGQPAFIPVKAAGIPNVLTALEDNRRIAVSDPDLQKRAIALTWLFHLVGDVHQPLHTSQLFSVDYPNGDQGGSQICIRTRPGNQPVNLHSFWDEVITRSERLAVLQKLATFLRTRPEFAKPQLTELGTTDFEGWAKESFQAATAVAYMGGTLTGAPKNHNQDCREVAAAPVLSLDYIATARRVADRRIVLAGYRLADLLAQVVGQ